jgi:indole-3-glycerol phosphate synthase
MGEAADTLRKIYDVKAAQLEQELAREPYEAVRARAEARAGERRGFLRALRDAPGAAFVTEIKRASPSAGLIARNFDPVTIARTYENAGADAISVLTERDHFLGELDYLDAVRTVTPLPLLRKDFLWTRYQIAQSAAYGADCVLLIVAGMNDAALRECIDEAQRYALDVLVEAHDELDLQRAVSAGALLIGINNRSLRTLVTDLAVSEHLLPRVPSGVFSVAESGMRSEADVARLRAAGAKGFLIGEALMRADDPRALLQTLRRASIAVPAAAR